ncbi:MAG: hypothetical protein WEA58_09850 [Balneolaceae bacterium]
MNKKYIVPALAIVSFLLGSVSMILPFLPLGWLLWGVSALLVVPYFKHAKNAFGWISEKDSTGFTSTIAVKIADLYRWADDAEKANEVEETAENGGSKA